MADQVFLAAQPRTTWIKRVAGRLLHLSPQMNPLDAVRRAMEAFPDSQHQNPEDVADSLFAIESSSKAPPSSADDPHRRPK